MLRLIIIIISTVLCPVYTQSENNRFVCYHTNWAQYRPAPVTFNPEDIDPFLCTHIIYSFAKIDDVSLLLTPYEWNDESTEWSTGNYEKFINLKQRNFNLKLLLAVGGWNHGVTTFSAMAATATTRRAFISHAIDFLRNRDFDGLDLDWEFPAARGSPPGDKEKFTTLCQELRAAFEDETQISGRPRLLLSAAVAAGHTYIDAGYEIEAVSNALDFVSLMAYDLRGSWESVTGHHTALHAGSSDSKDHAKLVWEYAVDKWLDGGCPPSKLNVGFGAYGRGFTLAGSKNSIGAPTTGPSSSGTYTREPGFLAYYEICEKIANGFTRVFDAERMVPYAYGDGQWVGYDDVESIQKKVNLIKTRAIGGGMVWAMDLDDFKGEFCGEGPWPILRAIRDALNEDYVGPSHLPVEPTTSGNPTDSGLSVGHGSTLSTSPRPTRILDSTDIPALAPTDGDNGNSGSSGGNGEEGGGEEGANNGEEVFSCEGRPDGTYDDPNDCTSFYQCWGNGQHSARNFCGNDLLFNPDCLCCDFPASFHCLREESPDIKPTNPAPTDNRHSDNGDESEDDGGIGEGAGQGSSDDIEFSCKGRPDGTYADPSDCTSFYQCWGNGKYSGKNTCGSGLVFNPNCFCCDWPENYDCSREESPDLDPANPTFPVLTDNENSSDDSEVGVGIGAGDGQGGRDDIEFSCEGRSDGTYDDPSDCSSFYQCWGNGKYSGKNTCGSGLVFNPNCLCCDWPANYDCSK